MTDEEEKVEPEEKEEKKEEKVVTSGMTKMRTGCTIHDCDDGKDIFHLGCGGGTRAAVTGVPLYDFEDSDDFNTSFMWQWYEYTLNGGVSGGKMWWGYRFDFMCALWDGINVPQALSSGLIFPVLGLETLENGGIVHDEWNFMRSSLIPPFGGVDCHFMVREFAPTHTGEDAEDPYFLMDILIGFHQIPFYGPLGVGPGNPGVYFAHPASLGGNWQAMVYVIGQPPTMVDTGVAFEEQIAHKFHVHWTIEAAYFYIDDILVATITITDTGPLGWPFDTIMYAGIGFMNLNEDDTIFYPAICQPFVHAIGKEVKYREAPP